MGAWNLPGEVGVSWGQGWRDALSEGSAQAGSGAVMVPGGGSETGGRPGGPCASAGPDLVE